jgi:hypothetical protein
VDGTIVGRGFRAAGAAALLLGLIACGGDGAGSTGGSSGFTQSGGGGGSATVEVTVSGAIPASGNASVTGAGAVSALITGTTRRVTADGSGNGLQHRFTVDYDEVTGTVFAVTHGWGASLASLEGATQCVRTVTVAGQAACGAAVSVDPASGRVQLSGAVLRGAGTFTSILSGRIDFTSR